MSVKPEIVADNEVPGPEPDGFWEPVHREVRAMTKSTALLSASDISLIDE